MAADKINDGGPAFPSHFNTAVRDGMGGMTLRDYFAAKAMQAIYMRLGGSPADTDINSQQYTAEAAYNMADAMLKERSA